MVIVVTEFSCICPECGMHYKSKYGLNLHEIKAHGKPVPKKRKSALKGDKPNFNCEECGQGFITSFGVKRHETKIHGKSKTSRGKYLGKFPCEYCEQRFKTKSSFKRHLFDEHGKLIERKPYAWKNFELVNCEYCGVQYKSREGLQKHVKNVHGKVHKTIDNIEKVLKSKSFFPKHMAFNHERRQPKLDLIFGTKIESAEMIFYCTGCTAIYYTKSGLDQHIIKEHKERLERKRLQIPDHRKKIKCDICNRMYDTKRLWDYHVIDIHTKDMKKTCRVCGQSFTEAHNCYKHFLKHHQGWKSRDKEFLRSLDADTLKRYLTCYIGDCEGAESSSLEDIQKHITFEHIATQFTCIHCDILVDEKQPTIEHIMKNHINPTEIIDKTEPLAKEREKGPKPKDMIQLDLTSAPKVRKGKKDKRKINNVDPGEFKQMSLEDMEEDV